MVIKQIFIAILKQAGLVLMIGHRPLLIISLSISSCILKAQNDVDQVYVDNSGVMRWAADNSELHGFGVNYTLPFAHEYRMAKGTGIPLEDVIRQDIYHMARLDLDFYRVHVWDTEISDTLGNLINNDHLRLLDFTLSEMKERGIRSVITPLAYWGNGWPERDEVTPGFSYKYGKEACLTNANAIEAQANYLEQFLNHVNPYTGIAYKDDPYIIGFEICNEPHHNGSADSVTSFINLMVSSIRRTGCTKPVFYNMSHSIHLADAYLNADIQGGTFQWYPTNLVSGHQINGNFLPQVRTYSIPFASHPKFRKMAKIIYEFDPADVGGSIMYPAMALAFREAGMQLAAQFEYDAICWAQYNTNYGTHFMNLAYAPRKAISLKIASAVFHNVEMYQQITDNTRFDSFSISYTEDLAEWVTDEKFFYTNNTSSQPDDPSLLREIAGCGSSPLVKYSGTGAYFLDKISDGVWRLEVMPDAYWIDDPYSPVNPQRQKAAVSHTRQLMTFSLPNLGKHFVISPVNEGNTFCPNVTDSRAELIPGVYILKRDDVSEEIKPDLSYKNIKISEYAAPVSNLDRTVLWNHSSSEATAGKPLVLNFEVISPAPVNKVVVFLSTDNKKEAIMAVAQSAGYYQAEVPADMVGSGFLNYQISVEGSNDTTTFPGGRRGDPRSWKNRNKEIYTVRLVPGVSQLTLWDAERDWEYTFKIWNRHVNLGPTSEGETSLAIQLEQLPQQDPVNQDDRFYAFKFFFGEKVISRRDEFLQKRFLVVKATNNLSSAQPLEVGLVDKNGSVTAGTLTIEPNETVFKIALSTFTNASFLVLPRPFPEFLPFKLSPEETPFDWSSMEAIQIIVKPGKLSNTDLNIERIWLE